MRSFLLENVPRGEANSDVKRIRKVSLLLSECKRKCWPLKSVFISDKSPVSVLPPFSVLFLLKCLKISAALGKSLEDKVSWF